MTATTTSRCVIHVVGVRPSFMKVAPVLSALELRGGVQNLLVQTGQHYDEAMSDALFAELEIPAPDMNLDVGSGTRAEQSARVLRPWRPSFGRIVPIW